MQVKSQPPILQGVAWSQVQKVLEPKVIGTVNLHHATKSLPFDFFLMTSSIVGTVGTPSQGAYTAANAFQDSSSRFRPPGFVICSPYLPRLSALG